MILNQLLLVLFVSPTYVLSSNGFKAQRNVKRQLDDTRLQNLAKNPFLTNTNLTNRYPESPKLGFKSIKTSTAVQNYLNGTKSAITTIYYYHPDGQGFTFKIYGNPPVPIGEMIDWVEKNSQHYTLTPFVSTQTQGKTKSTASPSLRPGNSFTAPPPFPQLPTYQPPVAFPSTTIRTPQFQNSHPHNQNQRRQFQNPRPHDQNSYPQNQNLPRPQDQNSYPQNQNQRPQSSIPHPQDPYPRPESQTLPESLNSRPSAQTPVPQFQNPLPPTHNTQSPTLTQRPPYQPARPQYEAPSFPEPSSSWSQPSNSQGSFQSPESSVQSESPQQQHWQPSPQPQSPPIHNFPSSPPIPQIVTEPDYSAYAPEPEQGAGEVTKPGELWTEKCGILQFGLTNKIVGGRKSSIEENPWQVAIINEETSAMHCSGSIITSYHVLTAGHCFASNLNSYDSGETLIKARFDRMRVIAGTDDNKKYDTIMHRINEVVVHPKYSSRSKRNDLAILFIKEQFIFGKYIQPICLPTATSAYYPKRQCKISGWGKTSDSQVKTPEKLRSALISITTNADCIAKNRQFIDLTASMFCAGDFEKGGVGTCQGDSGGPFACRDGDKYFLYGVTSGGVGCAKKNFPGIYVRVSLYSNWIRRTIEDASY